MTNIVSIPTLTGSERSQSTSSPGEKVKRDSAAAFEVMFVTQMVDEMMKTVDISQSMGKHAAEMWRSVLSQALAENLVEAGGLGLTDNVYRALDAYNANKNGDLP